MSNFPSTAGSFSWRELTDTHYVQPGLNCGFSVTSQGQELTAHAGKRTGRKLMKRIKKDF